MNYLIGALGALAFFLFAGRSKATTTKTADGRPNPFGDPLNAQSFDPDVGVGSVKTKTRFNGFTSFPVDVFEWGPNGELTHLIVASDDNTSFVGFVPASTGKVTNILAKGPGPLTGQILKAVTQ